MRNSAAMDVAVNPAQVTTTRAPGCWQDDSVAPALTGDEERRDDPNPPTPPADTYRADANRNAVTSTAVRQLRAKHRCGGDAHRQPSLSLRWAPIGGRVVIGVTSMGAPWMLSGIRQERAGQARLATRSLTAFRLPV